MSTFPSSWPNSMCNMYRIDNLSQYGSLQFFLFDNLLKSANCVSPCHNVNYDNLHPQPITHTPVEGTCICNLQ